MCFRVHLWHASHAHYTQFDFALIGATSLKYGYGIYFSRERARALEHVRNAKYLYRIDLSRKEYKQLLRMHESIDKQSTEIKNLANQLGQMQPLSRWIDHGGPCSASGISLYKAACNSAASALNGVAYEKAGANLLLQHGIPGAITRDNGEEVVTLYCPKLAKIANFEELS